MRHLSAADPEMARLIEREARRVETTVNLIAAENHPPPAVAEALGSVLGAKTIEGYPGNRFHAGCTHVDAVERLAVSRARALFGAGYANVQPHSGTAANLAVYFGVLELGDRVLAMSLPHGGHLSHGHRASVTSRCFRFRHYGVNPRTERIDYEAVRHLAEGFRPAMIVAGASSYPRLIDYGRMAEIAAGVSAYLLVDMAHIAGLVAAGTIPSPVPHCDFATFTGYKTMMGGRGGVILARREHGPRIDSAVFPGCQGTSAVNLIAAKAVIFRLAATADFAAVQRRTLDNAALLAAELERLGYRIVTGGTDNHQVLVDVGARGMSGGEAEKALETAGILANRNVIPSDGEHPRRVGGIRLGTAAISARGMGPAETANIAALVDTALSNRRRRDRLEEVAADVSDLCLRFPVAAAG